MDMDTYCKRFAFMTDMNGDLAVTISDVALLLKAAYLLPSTALASVLHRFDGVAHFLEVDCTFGQGLGGAIFSFLAWFMLAAVFAGAGVRR